MAPIALYPDSLLAQILTASTYPLEIVQAARFVKQNKELKGEKLMEAAKDKDWDPSVKAMLEFPDVLSMMDEKIEWTQKLGDAFLDQQKDVMESVQRLRRKANESGNLKTTKEQIVIVEKETKVIVIESASPEVVYVPTYNPTVVYGAWPYPAYPPYPVYAYPYGAGLAFTAGVALGAAARRGYGGWGCGWGNNEININNSTHNNFTKNNYNRPEQHQNKGQNWKHNPEHRGNAQYKNQKTAQKYGQQRSGSGGPGQAHPTPGATAVVQGREAAEDLKPATSVVGVVGRAPLVVLTGAEVSVRRAMRGAESRSSASRSSGASSSSGGASRGQWWGHPAAVEEPPVAAEEAAVVVAVVEQEIEKNEWLRNDN